MEFKSLWLLIPLDIKHKIQQYLKFNMLIELRKKMRIVFAYKYGLCQHCQKVLDIPDNAFITSCLYDLLDEKFCLECLELSPCSNCKSLWLVKDLTHINKYCYACSKGGRMDKRCTDCNSPAILRKFFDEYHTYCDSCCLNHYDELYVKYE